jgi:hypothetical protein
MIEVDPLKRITIQGIRESPWFRKDLPEYLLPLPDLQDSTFDAIDEVILVDLVEVCLAM